MRQILTILFILAFGYLFGQDFFYPTINSQGKDIESFIPNGWMLLDSVQGDLNNDGYKDVVLVIQHKDSVQLDEYSDLTQPRMLLILFRDEITNSYKLVEQNKTIILNHDNPNMTDPYIAMFISNKGVLQIKFEFFATMGSYDTSNFSYKFRYQNNEFALIGADYWSMHRGTGKFEETSYNFLTKKLKKTTGNIQSNKTNTVWEKFYLKELKTLKTFKHFYEGDGKKQSYISIEIV